MGRVVSASDKTISEAAELLRSGKLVAIPTETVYGLGANALDGKAVAAIFEAKGRPGFNPLIIHVPDAESAAQYVEMNEMARKAASHFWPGPLTMVLPRRSDCAVSELCSAGLPTLAVRVPSHPVAQKLLKESGLPVAAPSANRSGTLSPTAPAHVQQSLGDAVDMVLAAGLCDVGLESTVLDVSGDTPAILRSGAVTKEQLEEILGTDVVLSTEGGDAPKSPGQLLRHYAPSVPVRMNAVDIEEGEALLAFGSVKFMGVRGGGAAKDLPEDAIRNLSEDQDLLEAASNLFRMLHELDRPKHKAIAVMAVPETGIGLAINDRLRRAVAAHQ